MHIYCPVRWTVTPQVNVSATSISLNAIIPRPGQQVVVEYGDSNSASVGDNIAVLWQPPVSTINGWAVQPSEIRLSYLVSARVTQSTPVQPGQQLPWACICLRHTLDIVSCEPLLAALRRLPLEETSWALPGVLDTTVTPHGSFLTLDQVSWCGTTTVDGLTYMNASTTSEAHIELILYDDDVGMVGLFCSHSDPGGAFTALGRRYLSEREANSARRAMRMSQKLIDASPAYLRP